MIGGDGMSNKKHVQDPGRLRDLAAAIAAGDLSPVDLVQRCLDRIAAVEPYVEAWREIDSARALETAARRAAEARDGRLRGALHGIPIGVKDIIDVEGLPTRCNSRARQNAPAATADAEIVIALKSAGAIILGKAHTTEFAFFDPSPARNPHNTDHTPGGSSSGSAAVVACGAVPASLGTQTMASLNRPAAYCGIGAFKPSTRSISGFGVAPLAASYDTTGFFGYTVDDAVYAFEAVAPSFVAAAVGEARKATIALIDDPLIADADKEMAAAFEAMAGAFRDAGNKLERRAPPVPFRRIGELHWTTMIYEAGRAQAGLLTLPADQVGVRLRQALTDGRAIPEDRYLSERAELDEIRRTFFAAFADFDAFLWPAAPGPAPVGIASTGEPRYIAPWTTLGGPIVTMPAATASNGLPLGCILAGHPGRDRALGALARRLDAATRR